MEKQEFEAIYEGGVFKPVGAVALPSGTKVLVSLKDEVSETIERQPVHAKVFELLSHRYNSGQVDVAVRHNEHQP